MEAVATWPAIAVLGGGLFATIFWPGSRIDTLGDRIIDQGVALNGRIDTLWDALDGLRDGLSTG